MMPATDNATTLCITEGDRSREELALRLLRFADVNEPVDVDADFLPQIDRLDLGNPRASLLSHPGFQKIVRCLARVVSASTCFEATHFYWLNHKAYIAELQAEVRACGDETMGRRLISQIDAVIWHYQHSPAFEFEYRLQARELRQCVMKAMEHTFTMAQRVVSRWQEVTPAEGLRDLMAELDRLERENLAVQLRWFGLADFITANMGEDYGA